MSDDHDLLDDDLLDETADIEYYKVSREKRFGHYVVDLVLLVGIDLGIEYLYYKDRTDDFFYEGTDPGEELLMYALSYITLVIYYTCTEYFLNGKSLGKFATNTRVVRRNGGELTFLRVLGRSAARLIPFDAFSIFFNEDNIMWHDSLSDTMVVED